MKRLMVFIDNSYLVHEARRHGVRLNHKKLVKFLTNEAFGQYDLSRAIIYCSIDRSIPDEQIECLENLYDTINRFPNFEVKRFYLKLIIGNKGQVEKKIEKCVDVALATDLVAFAHLNAFDVAIVCSGDEDYIPAIKHVMSLGKEIYVVSSDESSSRTLVEASLGWLSLTKNTAYLGEPYTHSHSNSINRVFVLDGAKTAEVGGVRYGQ